MQAKEEYRKPSEPPHVSPSIDGMGYTVTPGDHDEVNPIVGR